MGLWRGTVGPQKGLGPERGPRVHPGTFPAEELKGEGASSPPPHPIPSPTPQPLTRTDLWGEGSLPPQGDVVAAMVGLGQTSKMTPV